MRYCVGAMTVQLHLPHSHSLKERRSVVNSLKERIGQRFNVSVCEESSESWQIANLAFACVAQTEATVEQQFRQIRELMESDGRAMVMNPQIEYYV